MDAMLAYIAVMNFIRIGLLGLITDQFVISFVVSKINIFHQAFRLGRC